MNRSKKKNRVLLMILTGLLLIFIFSVVKWHLPSEPAVMPDVADYQGVAFSIVNENRPFFDSDDRGREDFEEYQPLDRLGRCGRAYAMLSEETMPQEQRQDISSVHPSGFENENRIYHRCHLIAFSLAGENANDRNLITGTAYMNVQGMKPFESYVHDYIEKTHHHVLYRVTPVFEGRNLVASGVLMEAASIEDEKICFCIYVYNVQPGAEIDYRTGKNRIVDENAQVENTDYIGAVASGKCREYHRIEWMKSGDYDYVVNINTGCIHKKGCAAVKTIRRKNCRFYRGDYSELLENGYHLCGICLGQNADCACCANTV